MRDFLIVKAPLRITLGGGGTDIPAFYKSYGYGVWASVAIDKFVYVIIKPRFEKAVHIKYSDTITTEDISRIPHPIIRTALLNHNLTSNIEIGTFSDLPSRLGLGSSGAFTVALLRAIHTYKGEWTLFKKGWKRILSEEAFDIEHNQLHRPVGKQDHYSATYGGLSKYSVGQEGVVTQKNINGGWDYIDQLEERLSLIYTGRRQSYDILSEQQSQPNYLKNFKEILDIGEKSISAIENRDFQTYAELLNQHWKAKCQTCPSMNNENIDQIYAKGLKLGAIGGKLIGAGGSGFFLFMSPNHETKQGLDREFGDLALSFKLHNGGVAWKII